MNSNLNPVAELEHFICGARGGQKILKGWQMTTDFHIDFVVVELLVMSFQKTSISSCHSKETAHILSKARVLMA